MTVAQDEDRLLVIEEVADRLRTSKSTLQRWAKTGQGPKAARLGRRLIWRESEVQAWIDARFAEGVVDEQVAG